MCKTCILLVDKLIFKITFTDKLKKDKSFANILQYYAQPNSHSYHMTRCSRHPLPGPLHPC